MSERYRFSASGPVGQRLTVRVLLTADRTQIQQIKQGRAGSHTPPVERTDTGLAWRWRDDDDTRAELDAPDARLSQQADGWLLSWQLDVPARGSLEVGWTLRASDRTALLHTAGTAELDPPSIERADPRLARLLRTAVADLNALRLTERDHRDDVFYAAGSPWFLTLFGRDSLITARFVLPHNLDVARGTLRVLARRQGTVLDIDPAEAPGKIMHELRGTSIDWGEDDSQGALRLPPVYYGTIDATLLWIMLLDDAERAGLDEGGVRELLPHLRRALDWLREYADADGDGFIEYQDLSGHGLANQGWKDSGDSIRFADGHQAKAPVALCEVQGYAHAAALDGARLLEHYEGDTAAAQFWRGWATELAVRFRQRFWAEDARGRYPVLALDADKQQVDAVASNMGHLLGTGIVDDTEAGLIVDRLMHPTMNSGYGIRTLSSDNGGYWPLSYHVGSVWTHDTGYIIDAMLRQGFTEQPAQLAAGLLQAAEGFGYRLPELFGGQPADQQYPPMPYPASCLPQAWAAASALVIARALGQG